jgi:hypothetical protein
MQLHTLPWLLTNSHHECDTVVRIHGNWCGPNWTNGKAISARDYLLAGGDFKGRAVDRLDRACRQHDQACSGPNGCSARADRRLAVEAGIVSIISMDPLVRAKAKLIASGILAASLTR